MRESYLPLSNYKLPNDLKEIYGVFKIGWKIICKIKKPDNEQLIDEEF